MTPEEIAESLRAKGYRVDVVHDSIHIFIDSKGSSVAAEMDIRAALQPYQEAALAQLERWDRVTIQGQRAELVDLRSVLKGSTREDFDRELALYAPVPCEIDMSLCSTAEPKNLPFYRRLEKKGCWIHGHTQRVRGGGRQNCKEVIEWHEQGLPSRTAASLRGAKCAITRYLKGKEDGRK
ncbi:hypothetical protein [Ferribacterium limneticum]|uniref:hypothetical protein n=1 Tax=Ferribacterium limneticum TaxID=76259 RepID=UPI001CF8E9BD|nr:hypothetical protein [Ferribacterium limneticum]UCV26748.1 hypothetical protein KI617_10545 [Ferribacterium limneticum]UCV30665.1 hypothetical protein KI608_10545 [Ferribacterium limneticum]